MKGTDGQGTHDKTTISYAIGGLRRRYRNVVEQLTRPPALKLGSGHFCTFQPHAGYIYN